MKSAPPCAPSKAQAIPRTIRVTRLIERFREVYPTAHCELDFSNPLELLVATILSAQCTDKRVNIVTKDLFKRFRTAKDYADVPQEELENAIRSTGFYRSKAKSIRSMAKDLVERHQSQVPSTMAALVALAGVGRKTANVVLGNAFQVNEGIVVDTHVTRLAHRLGLTKRTEPEKIEQELMRLVPRTDYPVCSGAKRGDCVPRGQALTGVGRRARRACRHRSRFHQIVTGSPFPGNSASR